MSRPHRLLPAGFVYHIINRANEGARMFASGKDFDSFLDMVRETSRRIAMRICAFCLMPTHWHFVMWPSEDGAVSAYVHYLSTLHAVNYRRLHGRIGRGHVYQGRFRSFPVEGSHYYYNLVKYVESNARRSGLVERAEGWRWSSLHDRANGSSLVTPGPLVLPSNWIDIVNASPRRDELESLRACTRSGLPYGSPLWISEAAAAQGFAPALRPSGRPRREFLASASAGMSDRSAGKRSGIRAY
jgi:putative transposase